MVRLFECLLCLLAALALSACTVVLPLAEQALTPATLAVPETANTVAPTVAANTPVATATLRATPGPAEPDLEALDLPNEQLQALGEALFERGLVDEDWLAGIVGAGPITLLAPSDSAFAAVNQQRIEGLLQDREALERFVGAHVIQGVLSLEELLAKEAEAVAGNRVAATADSGGVSIEGLRVLQRDVVMPFGVLHVIDGILPASGLEPDATLAPTQTQTQRATSTATATARPTQTETPTATATATATAAPVPTEAPRATATFVATATAAPAADLMSTVESVSGLGRMAELLRLAELDVLLREERGLTLLAPTDDAFAELSDAEFARLTDDPAELLAWLERHLIPATVTAAELGQKAAVNALSGEPLTIRNRLGRLIVDGARVLDRDIAATNGIIHTVDTVVLP